MGQRAPYRGKVSVIGGGLAGLAAACELADAAFEVTVIEKRPYLGGRCFSFRDPETGQTVDNGQHVFMRCCTAYIAFLDKLGVRHKARLQERLSVPVTDAKGQTCFLRSSKGLPAPLHLLPSLLGYRHLSWAERLRAIYAAACMLTAKRGAELDTVSFRAWLERHGQGERAIARFWDVVALATLNDDASSVSADMALMVMQEGFLRTSTGADIGYAKVGLGELLAAEAAAYIRCRGGRVRTRSVASELLVEDGTVQGLLMAGGDIVRSDYYLCAVPHHQLLKLLPDEWRRGAFFSRATGLVSSPIVNAHVWYDRQVMEGDFAAFLDSAVQWLFNKSHIMGNTSTDGQYLCISLSGAEKYVRMSKDELRELLLPQLTRLLPRAKEAIVTRFTVTRDWHATFKPAPKAAQNRLPHRTPIRNLILAGDWTDTGWPSTMESAVRSGLAAAREIARLAS